MPHFTNLDVVAPNLEERLAQNPWQKTLFQFPDPQRQGRPGPAEMEALTQTFDTTAFEEAKPADVEAILSNANIKIFMKE